MLSEVILFKVNLSKLRVVKVTGSLTVIWLIAFLFSALGTGSAKANLIINGSFEDTHVKQNAWKWFYSKSVDGWYGSNIEIWDRYQGFSAFDGHHHAELNSHGPGDRPFSIYQTFDTTDGHTYDLSFAYSARRNTNEAFSVELFNANELIENFLVDDHIVRSWQVFNSAFVATGNQTTLRFTSVTPNSGTVGNFLDDIQVFAQPQALFASATQSVSEPSVIVLLLAGLAGIVITRRKSATKSA